MAITAASLVNMLDEAKIRRAVVLSEAFWLDSPLIPLEDSYSKVRAENDWTLAQVAQFPDRLIAFCSFNPIADHALQELERCSGSSGFKGLKFSFAMSRVDLLDARHIERLKVVFAEANRRRLPILLHLTGGPGHGAEHVRAFLSKVMPSAPDVAVQIAHLWGGEGFSEPVLAALSDAVEHEVPEARNLYFDLAEVWTAGPSHAETIANHVRRIGLRRILYGSDAAVNGRLRPREAWSTLQTYLPLSDSEFRQIASNDAPYLP
jgi:predicted TIM-barrel fold metal-dependent hydrolase